MNAKPICKTIWGALTYIISMYFFMEGENICWAYVGRFLVGDRRGGRFGAEGHDV